ncbi:hypothetical protein FNV43_RR02621 [Rhamnella rubrinervis]|uniref:Uncharacterized protein n=1 Tax=Rhamnella rubrinervis TaxID=2594499 RepID=A0A8K0HSV5_9ROSA|nr:hypothetical protein FNV43_RR02621 [Rhamnella rubrinervis]
MAFRNSFFLVFLFAAFAILSNINGGLAARPSCSSTFTDHNSTKFSKVATFAYHTEFSEANNNIAPIAFHTNNSTSAISAVALHPYYSPKVELASSAGDVAFEHSLHPHNPNNNPIHPFSLPTTFKN